MFQRLRRSSGLCGPGALLCALLVVAAAAGCRRQQRAPAPAPAAALSLPDALGGFVASPGAAGGAGYVRRTYTRGRARIEVTLARFPLAPGGFDDWVRMSRSFPQALLDAPVADANGFYQCDQQRPPRCDLLIQTRSGFHIEIRGGGTSSQEDVDAIARGLGLRRLAPVP
jgi:hypothetical protein